MVVSWRRLGDLGNLDAYVYRSLVNAGRRWRGRRWRGEIPSAELPEAPAADDRNRVEEYADMMTRLRGLPQRQRAVLVLRYYADLSEADTAEILGCSVGSVKSHASRGLATLRAQAQIQALSPARPGGLLARLPVRQGTRR